MKRLLVIALMAMMLGNVFDSPVLAQDTVSGRLSFEGAGTYQVYVPFTFPTPPNWSTVQTWEYQPAYPFFNQDGYWEEKFEVNQELNNPGWYRFRMAADNQSFTITGGVNELRMIGPIFREVVPAEIGLFVEDEWLMNNHFRLSDDSRKYSYFLVAQVYGKKSTMRSLVHMCASNYRWHIVGAIVQDERGFLSRVIRGQAFQNKLDSIMVDSSEVIVLIVREHYTR